MTSSGFSIVSSQAIPKRKPSLQENLLSYESRNYNFTVNDRFSGPVEFGEAMAMNCLLRAFDPDKLAEAKAEIIAITEKGLREWREKRSPSQLKSLDTDLDKPLNLDEEISNFKLMVKRDAKVKLDSSCLEKHPAAQNIMFHRKAINAIFSPCFDEFKNRVLSSLLPNIKFFTEMTNEKFSQVVKNMLGTENVYHVGEIDFSKFDKSQDAFIKAYERCLYANFGFDPELLDVWMEGEYISRATTLDGQLSFTVNNQRKSGASNTWIGNSIVTLGILALYYKVDKFAALYVSGDDSLIFSDSPVINHANDICVELGFETKFMTPSISYFCSKFLVFTGNGVFFVPDPYKLLVKLGARREEVDDKDLFEIFTSFRDLTRDFGDQRVVDELAKLVERKYDLRSGYTQLAISTIHCLRSNFSSFVKLYPKRIGWKVAYGSFVTRNKFLRSRIYSTYTTPFGEAFFLTSDAGA